MSSTWLDVPPDHDFGPSNLPYGAFTPLCGCAYSRQSRCGAAIGDFVIDLSALADAGLFSGPELSRTAKEVFSERKLNAFMSLGRPAWQEARATLQRLLQPSEGALRDNRGLRDRAVLSRLTDIRMELPADIGDYTDFYASREHAFNVGVFTASLSPRSSL